MAEVMIYINGILTGLVLAMAIMSVSDTLRSRKRLEDLQEQTEHALALHETLAKVIEKQSKDIFDKAVNE